MTLVVYSCIFGKTDPIRDPVRPGHTKFIMFTDQPVKSDIWQIVRVPTLDRPKRESRRYKQPSHLTFPEATATLWIDAAFTLLVDPLEILESHQGEITGFKHHKRTRITQEAPAIVQAGKGKAGAIYAQLQAYQAQGWDIESNPQRFITNGGFLLRRHTDAVKKFNMLWNHEVQNRSLRDQMSIDYCAHMAGVEIDYFDGNVKQNKYAQIHHLKTPTNDF